MSFVCKVPQANNRGYYTLHTKWNTDNFVIAVISKNHSWFGKMLASDMAEMSNKLKLNIDKYFTDCQNALTTHNGFSGITYMVIDGSFVWKKLIDADTGMTIKCGSVLLAPCNFEDTVEDCFNVLLDCNIELGTKVKNLESERESLNSKVTMLSDKITDIEKLKNNLESDLYTKFLELLNTKKRRIVELEDYINNLTNKKSNLRCIKVPKPKSAMNQLTNNEEDMYNVDTDNDDEDLYESEKNNKDSLQKIKKDKLVAKRNTVSNQQTTRKTRSSSKQFPVNNNEGPDKNDNAVKSIRGKRILSQPKALEAKKQKNISTSHDIGDSDTTISDDDLIPYSLTDSPEVRDNIKNTAIANLDDNSLITETTTKNQNIAGKSDTSSSDVRNASNLTSSSTSKIKSNHTKSIVTRDATEKRKTAREKLLDEFF